MEEKFQIGDVVYLKSDETRKFTICEVSKDCIKVVYFNTVTQTFCFSDNLDKRYFNILCREEIRPS